MTDEQKTEETKTGPQQSAPPKTLMDLAREVEMLCINNGLGARDVLHVLKEVEVNAIIAMTMGQIALAQENVKPQELKAEDKAEVKAPTTEEKVE